MKKILFLVVTSFFYFNSIDAQVYAKEELRIQEDQHIAEKNKTLGITTPVAEIKAEPIQKALVLPKNTYKLVSIEAIDYSKKHTEAEMKTFQQEMKEEFATNDIRITEDFSMFYLINRADNLKYNAKEIKIENDKLVYLNCDKCNMEPMTIIENNSNELILETPAQDSDSFYTVRFTLKK